MIGGGQHVLASFDTSQLVCKNIDAGCMMINGMPKIVVSVNALI
jgi:hypothetical protein